MLTGIFLTLLVLVFIVPSSIAFGIWVKRVSQYPDHALTKDNLVMSEKIPEQINPK